MTTRQQKLDDLAEAKDAHGNDRRSKQRATAAGQCPVTGHVSQNRSANREVEECGVAKTRDGRPVRLIRPKQEGSAAKETGDGKAPNVVAQALISDVSRLPAIYPAEPQIAAARHNKSPSNESLAATEAETRADQEGNAEESRRRSDPQPSDRHAAFGNRRKQSRQDGHNRDNQRRM